MAKKALGVEKKVSARKLFVYARKVGFPRATAALKLSFPRGKFAFHAKWKIGEKTEGGSRKNWKIGEKMRNRKKKRGKMKILIRRKGRVSANKVKLGPNVETMAKCKLCTVNNHVVNLKFMPSMEIYFRVCKGIQVCRERRET